MTSSTAIRPELSKSAEPFESLATEYDSWFDGNPLFEIELAALRAVENGFIRPFLEIGVGPGRFAQALQTEYGIDPAFSPLQLARSRSILGIRAVGEQLPVQSGCMGTVFILFTMCFLADPVQVNREIYRILAPGGKLVLGMIPRQSEWGKSLLQKKKENHPFYRYANLKSVEETIIMATECGFCLTESWSTLFQPPGITLAMESPRKGYDERAGFCVLVFSKKEAACERTEPDNPDN